MKRVLGGGVLGLAVTALLAFLLDQAVLQVRIHRGTGFGSVQVNQFLTTQLKGQKEEYDLMGTVPVTCVHSLSPRPGPEGWTPACWWLERHPNQWQ